MNPVHGGRIAACQAQDHRLHQGLIQRPRHLLMVENCGVGRDQMNRRLVQVQQPRQKRRRLDEVGYLAVRSVRAR
jgi:hypothetical protein